MKKYILYLMVSTAIFVANPVLAMDQNIKAPQIHLIVPPQHMDAMNTMQTLAARYPQIARETPMINSLEEFKVAKVYLNLTKKYNDLVFAAAMYGPTGNEFKTRLIQDSERVLKGLQSYIETLQGPSCNAFRSKEDQQAFERELYDIQYKTAQNHLMLLIKAVLTSNLRNNSEAINAHIQEIKKIKEHLSGDAQYRKKLQEAIREAQENVPALLPLFNPQIQVKPSQSAKRKNGRIDRQKTVNHYQKLSDHLPDGLFQDLESYDFHFQVTSTNILTEYLALSVKKLSHEEYIGYAQKLTDDCVALEKKGAKFKAFLLGPMRSSPSEDLTSDELADLYGFFCQRYTLPHKSPLQFLEASIFMFIQANKVEEALNRTEALKAFLLQKGPLSESFLTLRASVLALNGNSEEWRKILEDKRNKEQKEKAFTEQKQVNQIKRQQERAKKEQEAAEEHNKNLQIALNEKKEKEKKEKQESLQSIDDFNSIPSSVVENTRPEPTILPREKIKTRKAPQGHTDHDMSLKCKKDLSVETIETPKVRKDYPLSKNAFKTYQKIRRGDWKFPRGDLYNLFDKLGCKVDIEQGKGDHGTIPLPLTMTIHGTEGVVAVLPEFTQAQPENRAPRPLTIPNWDEKWDGRVPPYMRKSILKALDYLDATDETVHK